MKTKGRHMTYRELLNEILSMPDEYLDNEVYARLESDNFIPVSGFISDDDNDLTGTTPYLRVD